MTQSLEVGALSRHVRSARFQLSNAEFHLTAAEIGRVIGAASTQRDAVLLQLLAETGMRRREVVQLETTDLRVADDLLLIRQGKGSKVRLVPITEIMMQSLCALSSEGVQGPVFRSRTGARLSDRQVNRIVAEAARRVSIKTPNPKQVEVSPHLFRHSFARLWKQHGGSIETLSKILGHASVKTTWDLYGTEGLHDVKRNYKRTLPKLFHTPHCKNANTKSQLQKSSEALEPPLVRIGSGERK